MRPRPAVLAAILVALLAVMAGVLLVAGGDDEATALGAPRVVSVQELRDFARGEGQPVYWAGEMEGTKLELTQTSRDHVFLRYLDDLAPAGDTKPIYTTIGTYPRSAALQAVQRAGRGKGMVRRQVPGGGLAVWSRLRPTSVYLAFPGSDYLVEVFQPKARIARDLATAGRVGPIP